MNNNKNCCSNNFRSLNGSFRSIYQPNAPQKIQSSSYVHSLSLPNKQAGQTMLLGLAVVAILAVLVVLTYGNTRVVQDKTELVNAADAVAYSAGVAVSRELNFLAYTNRAIIANHVTTGHLVSYKSWTATLAEVGEQTANFIDFVQSVLNWLGSLFGNPTLGNIFNTDQIRAIFEFPDVMAGVTTGLHIAVQQQLISAQIAAQQVAYDQLVNTSGSTHFLDEVMQDVASNYGGDTAQTYYTQGDILVNDRDVIDATIAANPTLDTTVSAKLERIKNGLQYTAFNGIVQEVDTATDGGRLNGLVERSYQNLESSEWFTDRGFSLLGGLATRSGSTTTTLTDGVMGWQANDEYRLLFGLASASGSATAKSICEGVPDAFSRFLDFFNNNISGIGIPSWIYWAVSLTSSNACNQYAGIPRYYRLDDTFASNNETITLNAFISRPMGTLNNTYSGDTSAPVPVMTVMSEVEIAHERPVCNSDCGADPINPTWGVSALEGGKEEYANLYNPFWRPALGDPSQP